MIIRTGVNSMRVIGRVTQGVSVINLSGDDKVATVARVVESENSDGNDDGPDLDQTIPDDFDADADDGEE